MLNSRDTIVTGKRRCLYLAAAVAIVGEEKNRLKEQEKAYPHKRKYKKKTVWVREWLTRRQELGRYDSLLTEIHREDQSGYRNYLRITTGFVFFVSGMLSLFWLIEWRVV